jgi:hypothetical protein
MWDTAKTFTSRTPRARSGNWLFAIPIQGVSGDAGGATFGRPAGMPHTSSEESQGSRARRAQGPGWVCENSLYEDQESFTLLDPEVGIQIAASPSHRRLR